MFDVLFYRHLNCGRNLRKLHIYWLEATTTQAWCCICKRWLKHKDYGCKHNLLEDHFDGTCFSRSLFLSLFFSFTFIFSQQFLQDSLLVWYPADQGTVFYFFSCLSHLFYFPVNLLQRSCCHSHEPLQAFVLPLAIKFQTCSNLCYLCSFHMMFWEFGFRWGDASVYQ